MDNVEDSAELYTNKCSTVTIDLVNDKISY